MQNQLVTSEKECDELKEKLKNMSKKALLQVLIKILIKTGNFIIDIKIVIQKRFRTVL